MRISDWSSDVCSSDLGRSPAIGEIVEEFIARLGQDDTQKGYEAAIRTACYEPGNQENDEPAVDMEEVVGESRIFADPQNQTIIFLRDIDLVRNDENHSCLEQALMGGAEIGRASCRERECE